MVIGGKKTHVDSEPFFVFKCEPLDVGLSTVQNTSKAIMWIKVLGVVLGVSGVSS